MFTNIILLIVIFLICLLVFMIYKIYNKNLVSDYKDSTINISNNPDLTFNVKTKHIAAYFGNDDTLIVYIYFDRQIGPSNDYIVKFDDYEEYLEYIKKLTEII